ncbi:MAG: hypothetical protein A2W93_02285 [Bacteroidetes bacterium GWF2_43_63]|nr:MAG: hypothetical protein A2W94_13820 [Bacteroidetes bacterium GWE2_42_42]OFY53930.1 MAG: hypothetical protein A2W93_02285 [Bacteroidetes bacterium GWF2_43_63]HBG70573.1 hypothetical protein [Bacteroidales bacterium]HCB61243.1 hypothetical protein [Bacteroidales bacterium]HCY23694.1 hypothetical protein [Bacteroidales bacterium]
MKNLFFSALLISIIGVSFVSCSKNEIVKNDKESNDVPLLKAAEPIIGFFFTWDEWGRKKRDCHKAGLCNFRLDEIEIDLYSVPVQQNEEGDYFVILEFDKSIDFEDDLKNFYIDEDLLAKAPNGTLVKVPFGVYKFNADLGEMGGVELPLFVIE